MNILSKHKDYYDFVAGYDTDPVITYVRPFKKIVSKSYYERLKFQNDLASMNSSYPIDNIESFVFYLGFDDIREIPGDFGKFISLAFCNTLYNIFVTSQGEYIYTIEDFIAKVDPKEKLTFTQQYGKLSYNTKFEPFTLTQTDINKKLGTPVVADFVSTKDNLLSGIYINPKLSDLHFAKVKPATTCYQEIYNWLSDQKPDILMPSSPDDMSRYESKGFDKKHSFRNTK
jgi:hypothetical protein